MKVCEVAREIFADDRLRMEACPVAELHAILEHHFGSSTLLYAKSEGCLSEYRDSGQKMVALCR
jgi:hypothetical protein